MITCSGDCSRLGKHHSLDPPFVEPAVGSHLRVETCSKDVVALRYGHNELFSVCLWIVWQLGQDFHWGCAFRQWRGNYKLIALHKLCELSALSNDINSLHHRSSNKNAFQRRLAQNFGRFNIIHERLRLSSKMVASDSDIQSSDKLLAFFVVAAGQFPRRGFLGEENKARTGAPHRLVGVAGKGAQRLEEAGAFGDERDCRAFAAGDDESGALGELGWGLDCDDCGVSCAEGAEGGCTEIHVLLEVALQGQDSNCFQRAGCHLVESSVVGKDRDGKKKESRVFGCQDL